MRLTQTDEVGEIAQHFNVMTSQLEAQEKARNQWVSDTSHELRTPLTILRMRNEAMRDGIIQTAAEEWQRNLNTIADLTNLVDDLQAVSRSGERGWNLQKSSVDLQQWLDEVIQDHLPAFNAQGLNLSLQAKAGLVVSADVQRLTQVVRNVLVNSMRYTDTPGQTIVALSSDKKMARITISDSAPAVPDAALEHLFDRFYRCEGSRNRATGGSGLGLAICESIVKAHQGRIFAMHSEIGGLTIVIELPLLGA
jgi:two-component system sensor histidine kinase BaeS